MYPYIFVKYFKEKIKKSLKKVGDFLLENKFSLEHKKEQD